MDKVNRSEVVGRPLAALLANDGAKVYSVDIASVQEFHRGTGLKHLKHEVIDTNLKLEDVLPWYDLMYLYLSHEVRNFYKLWWSNFPNF